MILFFICLGIVFGLLVPAKGRRRAVRYAR